MSVTILKALDDRRLFASVLRDKATWAPWRAFLAALFALPMSEGESELYRRCTGRAALPLAAFVEAWLICGRRAGKSFVLALIAVFLAAFRDYRPYLGPGERATIMVIAADRRQARVIMRYVKGLLDIPALAKLVENATAESVELKQSVTIEVGTASYKTLRGYTVVAALCDELAFWPQEDSARPDAEILASLRPAMSTIPNAMLLCASSPYSKRGALYDAFQRYFGVDDPSVLVWKAATRTMNETVPQRLIDEATERDPANAAAEYGAEFRTDIEVFVTREMIEAAVSTGMHVRAPLSGVSYRGFVDPSGGSNDSMTMAIAHRESGNKIILDCIAERKAPFSPDSVVQEFAATFKAYKISKIVGDRYAGAWPREAFSKQGVTYDPAEMNRSELYLAFLPVLNSGRLDLLDNPRMVNQFVGLERRTARSGKDSVDHAPGAHDDVANAVAGAISLVGTAPEPMRFSDEFLRRAAMPMRRGDRSFGSRFVAPSYGSQSVPYEHREDRELHVNIPADKLADDGARVRMTVPRSFILTLKDGRRVRFNAGINDVPVKSAGLAVADHDYVKQNGGRIYIPEPADDL